MWRQPFAVPSVIFIAISVPMVLGLVPPNRLYGVRTPGTLSSEEIWYPANRHGGLAIIVASVAYLLFTLLLPYRRGAPGDLRVQIVHLVVWVGSLVLAILSIRRKIRSLDREGGGGRR